MTNLGERKVTLFRFCATLPCMLPVPVTTAMVGSCGLSQLKVRAHMQVAMGTRCDTGSSKIGELQTRSGGTGR